jgi:hypothetical protein
MQAYQILTDPLRREKYDATLPAVKQDLSGESDLSALWKAAAQRFFDQSDRYSPAIDALRISQPLIIEGDMLVVGIEHEQANLIGYLSVSITHNHIRRILTELYGKPLDFRLISGLSIDEWNEVAASEEKVKQRRANAQKVAIPQIPTISSTTAEVNGVSTPDTIWDELMEALARQWNSVELRAHALSRARFVLDSLPLIARAEDMTRSAGLGEDIIQRNQTRAFERIANLSSIESGVVALEYMRYRTHLLRGTTRRSHIGNITRRRDKVRRRKVRQRM